MDGGPSPSPSGSSRRLSELLDQKQEPFSLDLYLLEKGCSPVFLNAAVGSGDCACSTCLPWRTKRSAGSGRTPAASKSVSCASGVLRLLLCKILRGKMAPATAKRKQLQPPDLYRRHHFDVDGDEQRTPGDFEHSVLSHRAVEAGVVKAEEAVVLEGDGDDDSNKQLSPDSVLEQSPPVQEQKALLIFRELLQAAYSPTLLHIVADANDGSRSNRSKNSGTKTPMAARNGHEHWEEEDDIFQEALAEVTDIIATELAGARAAWPGDVQRERRDAGADIARAVMDAMVEETATELTMTGMDDHDFAVDTARPHCWC